MLCESAASTMTRTARSMRPSERIGVKHEDCTLSGDTMSTYTMQLSDDATYSSSSIGDSVLSV